MLLGLGSPEAARTRVAVLPVESHATLPDAMQTELRRTIARGLERAEVQLVRNDRIDGRLDGEGCHSTRCTISLAEAVGATWVLRPTITETDSIYEIRLEVIDAGGRTIASASERCEICGYQEVNDLLGDRSAALGAKVQRLRRQPPRLLLRSNPSGAVVWIDGRRSGRTPLEQEVTAGEHEVRVALPGHVSEHRRITAVAGTDDALSFTMLAEPTKTRAGRPWLGVGAAALTTGTALAGAGIALAAIDEREYERRCNPDPRGNCSHRYDTLAGGVALIVSGGVLLATGVAALVVDRRARRADPLSKRRWRFGRGLAIAF